jgi:hypothetical protein
MRSICLGLALVLGAFVAPAPARMLPDAKPCDMKQVSKAYYCEKCAAFVDTATVDKEHMTHKGSDHTVALMDACAKTTVHCKADGCSMSWAKGATVPACCKDHKTADEIVMARVGYRCSQCHAWATTETGVKHAKADCKGKAEKSCERSGTTPHVGAA